MIDLNEIRAKQKNDIEKILNDKKLNDDGRYLAHHKIDVLQSLNLN